MVNGRQTRLLTVAWVAAVLAMPAWADPVSVVGVVEKNNVALGESFVFQIQIEGSDAVTAVPDLPAFDGFTVQRLGGQTNNSTSVTIVNGQMRQNVRRGYFISYRLAPTRTGTLTIPAVTVKVGNETFRTEPIPIRVAESASLHDFRFRLSLSKDRCYVGEPVVLTVTWYIDKGVRNVAFAIPVLEDPRFVIDDVPVDQDPSIKRYRFFVGDVEAIAEQGTSRLDGKGYTTLTFRKVLIPSEAGRFTFPEATVSAEVLVGRTRRQGPFGNDPFSEFFSDDFFNIGSRGMYRSFVTMSEPTVLEVQPLPTEGQPRDFAGLVGEYHIQTNATPTEIGVGDPITLAIRISGSPYLKNIDLPPLAEQPEFAENFKIPKERSPATIENGAKVFRQTIRALHDQVAEIPPVAISYFDTRSARYRQARSSAIPLNVKPTKVLTSDDVEGRARAPVRNQLTARREGIGYNYEDPSVLVDQGYGPDRWTRSPAWAAVLGAPPLVFVALGLVTFLTRRSRSKPEQARYRKAYGQFAAVLRTLRKETTEDDPVFYRELLEAVRTYLGDKLGVPAAALTYGDVRGPLTDRGVSDQLLGDLKEVFTVCEMNQYGAGQTKKSEASRLLEQTRGLAQSLEKELRK